MPTTFATDINNDLYIGSDGSLVIASDLNAVLNICANATKAQLGEMLYNVDQGIPNFQAIWKGAPNYPQFESALRKTLLAIEGVSRIANLVITNSNNILSYSVTIITIYGTGVLNGAV